MTAFPEWLEQIGLAHCRETLQANGIDFDSASYLTREDLRRLGLNLGDSLKLLNAVAGRARPARAFVGELRLLTVMFCDWVGYTALSQHLVRQGKHEELVGLRQTFVNTCTDAVARFGGSVVQVSGDGVMIYFGLPAAGDDAERGIRGALATLDALKAVRAAEPINVRIGIATGPVVVGVPSGPGGVDEGLAVGETPNLAQRFQSVAGVNEIVIAHETRRLVGDTFELTDLGELPLKNIDGVRQAWRVDGVRRDDGRFRAAHGRTPLPPLVGTRRREDLALLLRDWALARGGSGRAVFIRGDAGIGKSRLAEELLERIAAEPHAVLRYQCSPFHVNAALYPVIAHLELAAGFARDDTPEQKLQKLEHILVNTDAAAAPLLASLLSLPTDRYAPLGLSAQQQKERTIEVLLGQVEALSRIKPLLMVVEDVHWNDPTSLELLDLLVARLPALAILLVITHRSDWQQSYAPRWVDAAHVTAMTLEGLPDHEVGELAGLVARGKRLPDEVVQQLVMRADGVPLYIEELTRLHLESGLLLEEADRYTLVEPLPEPGIPTKLNEFLIERLDRYKTAKELAQIGACIGRTFSYELLAEVSARKGRELDEELAQLTRTGLVSRNQAPPDAVYTFKHALVRDAAYDSLLDSQREEVHARIANALERQFPQTVAWSPELLAHHRTEAGQLVEAVPLWRRAGESALARVALQEAVNYLEKGLSIVERLAPSADRDILELSLREPLHSARLRWRGWATAEVAANATSILWLAQRQFQSQSLLVGLWGMWVNTITRGRIAESIPWARRLLVEGGDGANLDMQILGHRALLSSHFYFGELKESLEQRDHILALYDLRHAARWMELTGNDAKTAVGIFASQSLWMLGYPDQAARLRDQKDAEARRLGHPFDIGWALTWGGYVFDYLHEPDGLLAGIAEADRLAREQSIPLLFKVLVPMVEGLGFLRRGELPRAITALRAGIDGWKARDGHLNLPYLKAALADALAQTGDLDGGLQLLDECLEQIARPGWHERVWLPETLRLKGWMLMRQGKRTEAESQLRASLEWARRQHARSWELRSATTLAGLLSDAGRREAARDVLAPVYGWFTEGLETHDLVAARTLLEDLR